jgi:AraC-like DNA-binding protein
VSTHTPHAEITVPNHFVPALVSISLRFRIGPERLFLCAGIDLTAARAPGAHFSVAEVERLVEALIELTATPQLGLLVGELIDPASLGVLGQLVATSASSQHAITTFSQFKQLLHPLFDLTVHTVGDHDVLAYASNDTTPIGDKPYYAEALLSTVVSLRRHFLGISGAPTEATFRHPKPSYLGEYERVFGCPIHFGRELDTLSFSHADVTAPMLGTSPGYHTMLRSQAEDELARSEPLVVAQVRRVIHGRLAEPDLSLADAAKQLAMSARTLQRRLGEAQVSFRQLRDQARHQEARRLLARRDLNSEQVALALGYTDRSNFVRAFERWEGTGPRGFRSRPK